MSNNGSRDTHLSKNERRAAAREKARALRESQQKKERRGRLLLQGGLIFGLIAVVVAVALVLVNIPKPSATGPLNMLSDGLLIGENFEVVTTPALEPDEEPVATEPDPESDAIAIQIWVDYQCPACAMFEETNNEQITTFIEEGAATLEIHPVAILDRASAGARYSSRSANAAACVANYSPDNFFEFHNLLFANQPTEQTSGLDDEALIALAEEAGVADLPSVEECVTDERFEVWVESARDRAVSDPALLDEQGQFGTPTVLVNGERFPGAPNDATAFAQFIAEADGAAFSEESSSSPSPSPAP